MSVSSWETFVIPSRSVYTSRRSFLCFSGPFFPLDCAAKYFQTVTAATFHGFSIFYRGWGSWAERDSSCWLSRRHPSEAAAFGERVSGDLASVSLLRPLFSCPPSASQLEDEVMVLLIGPLWCLSQSSKTAFSLVAEI